MNFPGLPPDFILFVSSVLHAQHAQDWAVMVSFLLFVVATVACAIILWDGFRNKYDRKIFGGPMTALTITLGGVFLNLGVFGAWRTLDKIQDEAFILLHPNAVTTLSQQTVIQELPLGLTALSILVFIGCYIAQYRKMPHLWRKPE